MSTATPALALVTVHAFTREANIALRALTDDHYEFKMLLREDDSSDHDFNEMVKAKEMMIALEQGLSIEVSQDWLDRNTFALAQQDRKDLWIRR